MQNVVVSLGFGLIYFLVKNVPESVKLPLAKKAVIDGYTSQWLDTVYKDLTRSEQFKQTIIELLRGPQTQVRLRCSLC